MNHARGRGTGAQVEATELCDPKAMADIRRAEARVIYSVHDDQILVRVVRISHRADVYR